MVILPYLHEKKSKLKKEGCLSSPNKPKMILFARALPFLASAASGNKEKSVLTRGVNISCITHFGLPLRLSDGWQRGAVVLAVTFLQQLIPL